MAGKKNAPKAGAATGKTPTAGKTVTRKKAPAAAASNDDPDALARTGYLAAAQGQAKTVVYIHGIGNKPSADVLRCQWDKALFGRSMGERTRLAYWVNRTRYPTPEPATCADRDEGPSVNQAEQRILSALGVMPERRDLGELVDALAESAREKAMLEQMLRELQAQAPAGVGPSAQGLFTGINELLLRLVSAALLQDVHDLFFVPERREAMERSLRERLESGGGPFVVVAHSQGSMIAYEVLRKLDPARCKVSLLVTIGSPLGLPSVRSMFNQWTKRKKLPFPACVERWVNVADTRDPVALDADLSDDIEGAAGRFVNHKGPGINPDGPRNPHSGSGYLSLPVVRAEVRAAVGVGFDQPVSSPVLIKDLSDQMESQHADFRHQVLVELDTLPAGMTSVGEAKADLIAHIRTLAAAQTGLGGEALDDAIGLEDGLQRFVAARLTRFEIESLRDVYRSLHFKRMWRNAGKRALLHQSRSVIQADAAQVAYRALGERIGWAVLDTGIAAGHPHFFERNVRDQVAMQWDCTVRGRPRKLTRADGDAFARLDRNGHGTHVAGIIAGRCNAPLPGGERGQRLQYTAVAPDATLYGFKVLDDAGYGQDAWIIKALQQVSELNERSGQLVIHGLNLSLGGAFDPESYGCGFTPLCNELRRLWRQGVAVVLAAGNEGVAWLMQGDGQAYPANMDLTIGDPANLEEAIAVGSVHKSNPHTYGVSYFSSRGPTVDGRRKPDVVAPGEKIVSAHHGYRVRDPATWMVEMSGTSMAAPHVSGLLAAFLSVRREFVGSPDRMKQLLLEHCTDIGRDRYMQGCGIPNLVKMLAAT
ncbi:S8 family serine peptidase [Pseudoxanthomonas composti]|uniref:Peptidase n=1 Tax=Pseudoxanthomonas composti TaxID=2137479 RepID=A0A4Q1JXB9_9GAMM|nr:peptidase [Pseudoxanthomonas composti]